MFYFIAKIKTKQKKETKKQPNQNKDKNTKTRKQNKKNPNKHQKTPQNLKQKAETEGPKAVKQGDILPAPTCPISQDST